MPAKYPSWEPAYRRAWSRLYQAKHLAAIKVRAAVYYLKNKAAIQVKARRYYLKTQAIAKLRNKRWREKNPARYEANKAAYRLKMRKSLNTKQLARYYANKEEHAKKHAAYRTKTREQHRRWSKSRSAQLTDSYVREMLSKYSTISANDWPQTLVDAKRAELMVGRLTGDRRYGPR